MSDAVKRIEELVEQQVKLSKEMLDPETGLEARIKSLEATGKGASDLKEQVNKMASDNAKAIDEHKTLVETVRAEMEARQDGFETKFTKGSGGAVNPMQCFMKKFTDLGIEEGAAEDSIHAQIGKAGKSMKIENASAFLGRKAVTALAASGGDAIIPTYETMIVGPGEEPISLLDVLPRTPMSSPLAYWTEEVLGSRTTSVDIQSLDFTGTGQGTALGVSDFVFNQLSEESRTFGHTADISIQMLQDVPQMRGYIEGRMRYMLRYDLEAQVVNGAGASKDFNGIKDRGTAFDATLDTAVGVTNQQNLDVLRLAIHQCSLTYFPATFILLHPVQATGLELIKDGNQNYMLVNPAAGSAFRPWGVPVVSTTQQVAGDFTVAAGNHIEIGVRQDVLVDVSTEHDVNFEKLLATIRAYGRFAVKFWHPTAIIEGDFTSAKA